MIIKLSFTKLQQTFCHKRNPPGIYIQSPRKLSTLTLPLKWQYSGIAYQLYSLFSTLLLMCNVSLLVLHHSTTLTGGRAYCCSEL